MEKISLCLQKNSGQVFPFGARTEILTGCQYHFVTSPVKIVTVTRTGIRVHLEANRAEARRLEAKGESPATSE